MLCIENNIIYAESARTNLCSQWRALVCFIHEINKKETSMRLDNVLLLIAVFLGLSNGFILIALGTTNRYLADIYQAINISNMRQGK